MAEMMAARDAFGQALVDLGAVNERVVVLDADLATSTKASLFAAAYPGRFLEVGIAEQNMMSIAAGLAAMGFIPFTSTFACFASKRATDQIRVGIAQPRLGVKITGAYSGLLAGKTGKTHQSVQDLAIFRSMPHLTVVVPGDAIEVRKAVFATAEHDGPVYLRLTRDPSPVIFADDYDFRIGRAVTVREGGDVTVVTTGLMLPRALEAADQLLFEGVKAHVLHMPTVKPLDAEALVASAERTGLVVTAEEHSILGGLGGAVAEVLAEHRPTLMKRVGIADRYAESAPNDSLLEKYGLTAAHIVQACWSVIDAAQVLESPAAHA
ncbi:MAG: transketolase family protein [Thermoleophilia bacterium]|nr:transketolase family protein [Thermoleophilia bacterium]